MIIIVNVSEEYYEKIKDKEKKRLLLMLIVLKLMI